MGHRVGGLRNGQLGERADRGVDGRMIAFHHGVPAPAIALLHRFLDAGDRLGARHHPGQVEEAGLHHRVYAFAEAGLGGHPGGVDRPDPQAKFDDQLLHLDRQPGPGAGATVGGVQQRGGAWLGQVEGTHLAQQIELVHGHKVGLIDQIGRVDRLVAEPQMADGGRTGFARVIDEIALGVPALVRPNDLDGVLGGADRAVAAQPEEDRRQSPGGHPEAGIHRQGKPGDVIVDADGAPRLGVRPGKFGEYRSRHRRGVFLAGQPIAATDDHRAAGSEVVGVFGGGDDHVAE